jgi:hypothetical protein
MDAFEALGWTSHLRNVDGTDDAGQRVAQMKGTP